MIKVENIDVWGFEHAIRGMRNPMNSWDKSDSELTVMNPYDIELGYSLEYEYIIGENDLDLMRRLYKGGSEHRKYLRQIFVSMDITAPLYWWKEFDTYKVGTVANSCSTMHRIHVKEFTLDDFSNEHLLPDGICLLEDVIEVLNIARDIYTNFDKYYKEGNLVSEVTCKKDVWWQMIQLLPTSYNQRRTVTMNYENVVNMIQQRTGHKLDEWNNFVEVLKSLPYVEEIMEIKNS
jgi:hypothetical protein